MEEFKIPEGSKPEGLFRGLVQTDHSRDTSGVVIAAGPLTKQPLSIPYRIVLVQYDDGHFSVHFEQFKEMPEGATDVIKKCNFYEGSYFGPHQLPEAVKCFGERLVKREYINVMSLYRTAGVA